MFSRHGKKTITEYLCFSKLGPRKEDDSLDYENNGKLPTDILNQKIKSDL